MNIEKMFEDNMPEYNIEGALRTLEIFVTIVFKLKTLNLGTKCWIYGEIQKVYDCLRIEKELKKEEDER